MTDKQFEEAKLLYELLTKNSQLSRSDLDDLLPILRFQTSTDQLLKRLDRLNKGLPAEDELLLSQFGWKNAS
jgi:hypothetical protein